ncbi:hypothetical protein BD309DRAFT_972948 [Dichomitus squalens]|nr:hypothetical protein BD309DRAFT_972948 [Dichomitus squalens]
MEALLLILCQIQSLGQCWRREHGVHRLSSRLCGSRYSITPLYSCLFTIQNEGYIKHEAACTLCASIGRLRQVADSFF